MLREMFITWMAGLKNMYLMAYFFRLVVVVVVVFINPFIIVIVLKVVFRVLKKSSATQTYSHL